MITNTNADEQELVLTEIGIGQQVASIRDNAAASNSLFPSSVATRISLQRRLKTERVSAGIRFDVVRHSGLQVQVLLDGRVCGQRKQMDTGISPILKIASVR